MISTAALCKQNVKLSNSDLRIEMVNHMRSISAEVQGLRETLKMTYHGTKEQRQQQLTAASEDTQCSPDTMYKLAVSKPTIRVNKERCAKWASSYSRECLPAVVLVTSVGSSFAKAIFTDCYTCAMAKTTCDTNLRENLCDVRGRFPRLPRLQNVLPTVHGTAESVHLAVPHKRRRGTAG